MQRREFLLGGAGTAAFAPRALGANDRIRVGLIGAGNRGSYVAGLAAKCTNTEITAVSDVYSPRLERAAESFGTHPRTFAHYHDLLNANDIDAVILAPPDHWKVQMVLEAIAAGKDIYVEKPVTRNANEEPKLLQGVERSGRVVATGTQQRSWQHYIEARERIRSGELGRIGLVQTYWYQNYSALAKVLSEREPQIDSGRLNWDLWLGSAPKQPFDEVKFRYWRFFNDFGGGIFTDLMTHWIDVVQWVLDTPQPTLVQATGSTSKFNQFQMPDTVNGSFAYPGSYTVEFSGSLLCGLDGGGIVFRGDKALMELTRFGYAIYDETSQKFGVQERPEPFAQVKSRGDGTQSNVQNWLDCIRTRQTPNANLRAGVAAAHTSHLANRAMREKKTLLGLPG